MVCGVTLSLYFTFFLINIECPGLAEWSDSGIEVKNPLFSEETPAAKTEKQPAANKSANKK